MNFHKTWTCSGVFNVLELHITKHTIWSLLRSPISSLFDKTLRMRRKNEGTLSRICEEPQQSITTALKTLKERRVSPVSLYPSLSLSFSLSSLRVGGIGRTPTTIQFSRFWDPTNRANIVHFSMQNGTWPQMMSTIWKSKLWSRNSVV